MKILKRLAYMQGVIMKLFFLVLARDKKCVEEKIRELSKLNVPYLIVCGERINHPNIKYRAPKGKYDAINFGANLVPDVDVVALNDVDTKIRNFDAALHRFQSEKAGLLFVKVRVRTGPQQFFYILMDALRRRTPLIASGELMLIKHDVLWEVLPLKPCKTEDNYILFKVLEFRHKVVFCEECYVETERTKSDRKEEIYKRKTVTGLYQALSYAKPPLYIRLFFIFLPVVSPLLLVLGRKGYYWMRGILLGFLDYICGDRSGFWQCTYME